MGAVHNETEDRVARELMLDMPKEVREWLLHHFGNSLCPVTGCLQYIEGKMDGGELTVPSSCEQLLRNAHQAARHMAEDLNIVRTTERRRENDGNTDTALRQKRGQD